MTMWVGSRVPRDRVGQGAMVTRRMVVGGHAGRVTLPSRCGSVGTRVPRVRCAIGRGSSRFYVQVPDFEIWHSRVPNLTWTHIRQVLSVSSDSEGKISK